MRWKDNSLKNRNRETRVKTKFLLFPKTLNKETRWLEKVRIVQQVDYTVDYQDNGFYFWNDIEWQDTYKIILNGEIIEIDNCTLSYNTIIKMINGDTNFNIVYSITYSKGENNSKGCLVKDSYYIKVVDGMIINTVVTGNA